MPEKCVAGSCDTNTNKPVDTVLQNLIMDYLAQLNEKPTYPFAKRPQEVTSEDMGRIINMCHEQGICSATIQETNTMSIEASKAIYDNIMVVLGRKTD